MLVHQSYTEHVLNLMIEEQLPKFRFDKLDSVAIDQALVALNDTGQLVVELWVVCGLNSRRCHVGTLLCDLVK